MPIFNVRAPDGSLMKISGPEDATDEELIQIAEQNYKEKPKFKDYLKDVPKAAGRGAVGLLETSAIGASALLPDEYEETARKGIAGLAKPAKEYLAPSSEEVGESISSKLAAGVGSTLPFFAMGPAGLAGRVGAGALGVSAGAGEARQGAEAEGATKEERSKATLLGAPTGLLDILAPNIAPFKNLLVTAAARGGVEGLTEAAQKVAQNLIAKGVYKPEQEILVGAGEEGAYGAGVGALTSLIVDMTLGRRAKTVDTGEPKATAKEPSAAPEQRQVETLPPAPVGFDTERAAGLRAEAEQAEQDRLAGIEAGRMAEEQAAQEAVRGMPGFAGAPDINAELIAATRADQAEEQKRLEAERKAQIKEIERTQFSTDPFQDQMLRNRALQQISPAPAPETQAAPEVKPADPLAELTPEIPEGPTFKPKAPPKQVPMSPEDLETVQAAKQDLADVEKKISEAKKGGTDLFNRLKGAMSYQDVLEVAPEVGNKYRSRDADTAKKVDKYKKLVDPTGKARSLSSLVADGSLNEFLPEKLRIGTPGVDEAAAVQHIYDKLSSGETRSEDEANALKGLEDQRDTLQQVINEPQRRAELNYQAQRAATEQRGTEPLSLGDLIADAQSRGVDTDAVMERVAMQMPDATPAQYQGEVRNQIDTELAAKEGRVAGAPPIMEDLPQQKEKGRTFGTAEGAKIEKELTGKNFDQLVQWSINNAPNKFNKLVAQKVADMIKALKAQGVEMQFDLQSGTSRNVKMKGAEGITTFLFSGEGTNVFVQLNGEPVYENQLKEYGYPSGMSYGTIQHELLHVATRTATRWLPKDHPAIKDLNDLYKQVVAQYNKDAKAGTLPPVLQKYYERRNNALESADELMTWGLTDRDFQEYLSKINVGPKQTAFNKLVSLVRELLGIAKPFETAMEKLVRTTDSILDVDVEVIKGEMQKLGYAIGKAKPPTTQLKQQSLFSKRVQQLMEEDELAKKEAAPTPTQLGADSMEMLAGIGRTVAEPEPGYADKVSQSWKNYRDNPQATREEAYGSFRRFADQVETWAFSSDAGLNNQIRREIMNSMVGQEQKIGMLLNTSLSQTAHSDAVSNLFLMEGNIKYDTELHKWIGVKDDNNIINLSKKLDEIAEKNGLTKPEIELLAHTAFEARRTQDLNRFNDQIDMQVAAMKEQAKQDRAAGRAVAASALNDKANNLLKKKKVTTNMSPEALQAGLKLYDMHPDLKDVTKIWNGIRQNALDRMVETGLYTAEEAEMLMSVADYVPFFREDQIEEGKGPKEFLRSLAVQADKRLKGSSKPVNDIFDNMVRWTQYAINRGVRNRSGLALATTAQQMGLADRVQDPKDGENVVRVWEDGKQVYFSMQDPMFVSAFRGLESVSIPTVKFFSKFADILRQSVVLYPLFSIAQVPQDSFAAMFTSGLKPPYALSIPVRAIKEFYKTLRGTSKAHEELKNVGAVGVRDFTSAIIRADAEIAAGLKEEKGLWAGVKRRLGNWAMAADNAVRQATYEAALAQGLSRAEAIEKAFEIFNVRRRGNSQMLALAGQVIPFFNAYLAAQHVAYRTLTGVGTSPTERKAAFQTLAATTGAVMALSVLYAMMNGDDEDYLNKPTPTRDRLLMIPGMGGFGVPLRADIFALPKVLAEHTYLLMTDNGYEDPAKFRASMASLLANSIFSPTPVPQAIKPLAEAIMNYDFFQQKPLVGTFQQKKELGRQFEDSTSEFAKVLGSTNMVSPIVADHFIRGMFGSFGGLFLYATNPILADMAGTPRPSMSLQDALATIPNASAFVSKEYEVALRKDFYALKEVTDRVGATISDLKTRSPQELADYLSDEDVRARYALTPAVNQIAQQLTNIRKAVTSISQAPEERMNEDEKQRQIKQLREAERRLLEGVNLKALRERANL
jgi:hypothetical protein